VFIVTNIGVSANLFSVMNGNITIVGWAVSLIAFQMFLWKC
jgi:hypothetical protein